MMPHIGSATAKTRQTLTIKQGPLHFSVDMVRLLLQKQADLNKANEEDTPLIAAAVEGYVEAVRVLLDNGDEVEKRCKYGKYRRCEPHCRSSGRGAAAWSLLASC
ncbi:hypothetical protein V7S43_010522 [Phytophthora oleae]|uniref:Ankyrin repeat protein n=1 Tax=Phytophthora oleae TaxID=2107226 RepID=A0ABD3FBQ1_9STRA